MTEQEFNAKLKERIVAYARAQAGPGFNTPFGYVQQSTEYVIGEFDVYKLGSEVWLECGVQDGVTANEGQQKTVTEVLLKWTDRLQSKQELAEKIIVALKGESK